MTIHLTDKQKERLIQDLLKAGATLREKPLTPRDSYYSKSLGKRTITPKI